MSEVHIQMTALESRFEDELAEQIPGWHRVDEGIEPTQGSRPLKMTEAEKKVEESMVLGV